MSSNTIVDRKVAIMLADGCEEVEALTVVDLLYRAGIPHTTISINDTPTVTSSHHISINADTTVSQISFNDFDMIVLPGGIPGMPNLLSCRKLTDALLRFNEQGRELAAICASPYILAELGIARNKRITCNPGFEEKVQSKGAILTHERVTVTDNLITSQAMGTAIEFGLTIVAHYLGKEKAKELEQHIVY